MSKKKNPTPGTEPRRDRFGEVLRRWDAVIADLSRASSSCKALADAIGELNQIDRESSFTGDVRDVARESKHVAWVLDMFGGVFEGSCPPGRR